MKTKLGTLPLLLTSLVVSLGWCDGNKKMSEYGYVFHESTGQSQYIIMDGREVPVKFDDASNQIALKSFYALKPGIVYQNNEGDRIFVLGDYDRQSQSFRLSHWYIKVPFEEVVIEDETHIPHNVHKVTRQSLERTDFEPKNGFNPNDPAFDPKSFQKAAL